MKLSIEKKPADRAGRQQLLLTRNYGSYTDESGKRIKKRKRQSLDLFIYATPKDKAQRDYNKKTLELAERIQAQAIVDLANNKYHFEDEAKQQQSFIDYMQQIIEEKRKTDGKSNVSIWESVLIHLQRFSDGHQLSFANFDTTLLQDFRIYLTTTAVTKSGKKLSSNTASTYFNKVRAALNQAFHEGIIRRNPVNEVKTIKPEQNKRQYLLEDELRAAYQADCRYDVLKRAFLFGCTTGLRWSDIHKLKWQDVFISDGVNRITFNHKKNRKLQYLDLPKDAIKLMGEPEAPETRVFKGLKYSTYTNVAILQWMLRAGITKHITFHCARHTFAVRLLTNGADIYTVSKLLGHSELKTTQIYADIIESKRKEAMESLPSLWL
ncbi:mobilizable transposon, int protein [Alishewanella aestuarii B11]|uniref:Mobilizable transposon, int protein n=1 Tax=Alishewanella aestuarii B11 TaxID=1197174 RepID=J1YGB7_9ALTE|nr:site-specific integrase [Alishewanella aestuarii]EJI87000.1 mobilizable transposon, int protein [Alishewanella aestuarii B11]